MSDNRYRFIDVARGISIICIILGHLGNSQINRFVFTFHVPIFFLITGYFINKKTSIREFIHKRFRTLIIPYIISCICVIISAVIINMLINDGSDNKTVLLRWVKASMYGAGDNYETPFIIYGIGATWFLLATFWGSIVMRCSLEAGPYVRMSIIAAYFILGAVTTRICWFPLSIQAGGTAAFYMYIGYLSRDLFKNLSKIRNEIKAVMLIICMWLWIGFIRDFQSFWLVHNNYGRGVNDIINSIAASACVIFICYVISAVSFKGISKIMDGVAYLGRYSLIVLCLHIIELDTFPWFRIATHLFGEVTETEYLYIRIAFKLVFVIVGTVIISKISVLRRAFGYKK